MPSLNETEKLKTVRKIWEKKKKYKEKFSLIVIIVLLDRQRRASAKKNINYIR